MFNPKYAMMNFISPSVHLEVHTWRLALDKMRLARARGLRSCADASKRNKTARILKEGFKLSNKLAIKLYVCILYTCINYIYKCKIDRWYDRWCFVDDDMLPFQGFVWRCDWKVLKMVAPVFWTRHGSWVAGTGPENMLIAANLMKQQGFSQQFGMVSELACTRRFWRKPGYLEVWGKHSTSIHCKCWIHESQTSPWHYGEERLARKCRSEKERRMTAVFLFGSAESR